MPTPPRFAVVMGVSGSGKSSVAALLANRLGWDFAEADALHPAANVAKMAGGVPLTDADRLPWLHAVAATLGAWRDRGIHGVVACSALRRSYRAIIADGHADILFVYLHGDQALIAGRLAGRRGHFMPAALLDSQFATLEPPAPPEPALTLDAAASVATLVGQAAAALQRGDPAPFSFC